MSSKILNQGTQISGKKIVTPVDDYTYFYVDFRCLKNKNLIIKNRTSNSIKYTIDATVEDDDNDSKDTIALFGYDESIKSETVVGGTSISAVEELNDIHTYWRVGIKASSAGQVCSCELKYTAVN